MTPSFKKFLIFCGILGCAYIGFLGAKAFYVFSAQSNFDNKRYEKAAQQYEFLINLSPEKETYKLNLANALLKAPFNYETQKFICDFLEKYEGKNYTYPLVQKLNKFKADLDWKIGTNYIDKAPMSNQIVRWEDDAFPLKVSITGGDAIYTNAVKGAFNFWAKSTNNFFSFVYIDNPDDADIKVQISGSAKTNCGDAGCYYVAALTSPEIKNNILKHMNMLIYTTDPYGKPTAPDQLQKVAMHEIGHALGVMGHSDNPNDIMYASAQHNKNDYFSQYRSALSTNDVNTLNYLYMIVPHVSNVTEDKKNKSNKIYYKIVFGTDEQIHQKDIQEAQNYVNNAPNIAIGYLNLGNAYAEAGMYKEALETYQKGFKLSVDKQEKYNIVYNMATTCVRMKDLNKALEYAEYAEKISPTSEIKKLIHDIKYPMSLSNPEN